MVSLCVGVGASQPSTQNREVIQIEPSSRRVYQDEDIFYTPSKKVAIAKDLDNDGEGTFYDGSISFENSAIVDVPLDQSIYVLDGRYVVHSVNANSNIRIDTNVFDRLVFYCYTDENNAVKRLHRIDLIVTEDSRHEVIYAATQNTFNTKLAQFFFSDIVVDSSNALQEYTFYLFRKFFEVYTIGDSNFTFAQNINYNAPYYTTTTDSKSPFVVDASTFTHLTTSVEQHIKMGRSFVVDGILFDEVVLRYRRADGEYYYDYANNDEVKLFQGDHVGYYEGMFYRNSYSGVRTTYVNERLFNSAFYGSGDNSVVVKVLTMSTSWTSDRYRTINFLYELSAQDSAYFSKFNHWGEGYSSTPSSGDIGLGNVFTLLGQAFSSWLPIFGMEVVPGISLGLLIFTPLIVGIIILVIWLVKR